MYWGTYYQLYLVKASYKTLWTLSRYLFRKFTALNQFFYVELLYLTIFRTYKEVSVKHEPLTLITPEFETPLPPLQPAVSGTLQLLFVLTCFRWCYFILCGVEFIDIILHKVSIDLGIFVVTYCGSAFECCFFTSIMLLEEIDTLIDMFILSSHSVHFDFLHVYIWLSSEIEMWSVHCEDGQNCLI